MCKNEHDSNHDLMVEWSECCISVNGLRFKSPLLTKFFGIITNVYVDTESFEKFLPR